MTCSFNSFDDKFLGEIIHVQSLKILSVEEYLPANVLNCKEKSRAYYSVDREDSLTS